MSAPETTRDQAEELVGCGLLTAVMPFTMALYAFISGFVAAQLWRWFVVPTFHTGPLSLGAAVGVALLVRWATFRVTTDVERRQGSFEALRAIPKSITGALVVGGLTLLVGYVIQRWFL